MPISFEAVYEDGVLKPTSPLRLKDKTVVRLTLESPSWVEKSAGIMGWTGSTEFAERIATDIDLLYPPQES
jgi:predicted DNA-binding antitoxin AbrB/MazE fold protein